MLKLPDEQLVDDIQDLLRSTIFHIPIKILTKYFNERKIAKNIAHISSKYVRAIVNEYSVNYREDKDNIEGLIHSLQYKIKELEQKINKEKIGGENEI